MPCGEEQEREMTYEKSCEWCVYRDKNNPDICKNCSLNKTANETTKPGFELGRVDIWQLAKGLHDKGIQEIKDKIPRLSGCPECKKQALFFNYTNDQFECLNKECPLFGKPITRASELFSQIVIKFLKSR